MFQFRKAAALAITSVIAVSTLMSASAASTTKQLSSNFTLVNLVPGVNNGTIKYVLPDGSQWRDPQNFALNGVGDLSIYRQYFDDQLSPNSGSVVVSTDGPIGAVVQIQARGQTPTSGAYVGVSEGASTANVPLVSRRGSSLSGTANSQIIVQNAGQAAIEVKVDFISAADGSLTTSVNRNINPNASVEIDLDDGVPGLPEGWFGSATVTSLTGGGQVAVVSNFFTGPNAMQTFNAFTESGVKWLVPLFLSRVDNLSGNPLSSVVAVQNVSGAEIAAGAVSLNCTRDPNSTSTAEPTLTRTNNATAIKNTATFFFNPAPVENGYPGGWYGACNVTAPANVVVFVQMRFVGPTGDRAGAYGAFLSTGTNTKVVVPLFAKLIRPQDNGFASNITIQNLSNQTANVTLDYKKDPGAPAELACDLAPFNTTIPAGGSLQQNMRIESGPNSVPAMPSGCSGSLTVTSDQPIDGFVQFDFLRDPGDGFMAHNVFTLP